MRYVGRCRAGGTAPSSAPAAVGQPTLPSCAKPDSPPLSRARGRSRLPGLPVTLIGVRAKVVQRLSESDTLALLQVSPVADERQLIRHLREVGTDASVEVLRRLVRSSPEQRTRLASVITLGEMQRRGSEGALDALIASLSSSDPRVVSYASRALAGRAWHRPELARRVQTEYAL